MQGDCLCSATPPWPAHRAGRGQRHCQGQRGSPPSQGRQRRLCDTHCRRRWRASPRRARGVQQGRGARLRRRAGPAALDEIERAYAALGAPVQVELAHLADPVIGALLTGGAIGSSCLITCSAWSCQAGQCGSRHRGSRSGRVARRSSSPGSTSSCMASPTPTPQGCLCTTNSRGRSSRGPDGISRRPAGFAHRAARRGHRRRRSPSHGGGRRAARRRDDSARAPPPGGAGRAAVGPARRRRSRRLRHRRRYHAARIQVSAHVQRQGFDLLYTRATSAGNPDPQAPALA